MHFFNSQYTRWS